MVCNVSREDVAAGFVLEHVRFLEEYDIPFVLVCEVFQRARACLANYPANIIAADVECFVGVSIVREAGARVLGLSDAHSLEGV